MTDCRKQCVWRGRTRQSFRTEQDGEKRRGKMKREVCWMSTIFTIVLLGSAGVAQAQETQSQEIQIQETQEGPPGPMVTGGAMAGEAGSVTIQAGPAGEGQVMVQAGSVGEGGAFFENHIELLGFGGGVHGGKVVKGAPFSAVAVSESTQTLADGNHINRKTQSNVYRDGQGRIRREITIAGFGPMAPSGQPKSFVVINDPVAGTKFMLHPDQKTAEQMGRPFGRQKGALRDKMEARQQQEIASGSLQKEDLGTQTVSGVTAQGTRITRIIPAGQ